MLLLFKYFWIQICEMIHYLFFWWHVTGSFMSFIKWFPLVTWLIKAEKFITEDMHVWPKKIIHVYNKVLWNYYKLRQVSLLQSATYSYYKLRQLFHYKVRHGLSQVATGITKCDDYYKLRQYTPQITFWYFEFRRCLYS